MPDEWFFPSTLLGIIHLLSDSGRPFIKDDHLSILTSSNRCWYTTFRLFYDFFCLKVFFHNPFTAAVGLLMNGR